MELLAELLGRPDRSRPWFFTRSDHAVELFVPGEPGDLWGVLLPSLGASVQRSGHRFGWLELAVGSYRNDAGLAGPAPLGSVAEAWAAADTDCALAAITMAAGALDTIDVAVLGVLDLAWRLDSHQNPGLTCDLLSGIAGPDRRGFAVRRRRLLPMLAHGLDWARSEQPPDAALRAAWDIRGRTLESFTALDTDRRRAAAGQLLHAHASRVAGPDRTGSVLELAVAAQAALVRWRAATTGPR